MKLQLRLVLLTLYIFNAVGALGKGGTTDNFLLNAGTIYPNSQTVTPTTQAGAMGGGPATGGNGVFVYQWESSSDGSTWVPLGGTNSISYQPPILAQTTFFRRKVTSGSEVGYSNPSIVFVEAVLDPGAISPSSQQVAAGNAAVTLGGQGASGGACGGSYSYQWEESLDGSLFDAVITGATGVSYTPPPSSTTITRYYRRKVTCGSTVLYSNTAVVQVYPPLTSGTLVPTSVTINYNTSPGLLTSPVGGEPTGGNCNGSYSYSWQVSSNNLQWSSINGATSIAYIPGNLTATTYFRRLVACGNDIAFTNVITVNISTVLNPGTITSSNQSLNYFAYASTMTASAANGGSCGGAYEYQWEYSYDGVNYEEVFGGDSLQLNYQEPLTRTTYFRRRVICGTEEAVTSALTVAVAPSMNPGTLSGSDQSIQLNAVPATISASAASGGNCGGSYVYQWQLSYDGTSFQDIAGATGLSLTYTEPLGQTTFFRRRAICGPEIRFTAIRRVSIISPIALGQPTNPIDSVLNLAGVRLDTLLRLAPDSLLLQNTVDTIAVNEKASLDNFGRMLSENTMGVTLADTVYYHSFPAVDTLSKIIDNNQIDTVPVFLPEVFDEDLQQMIANNELGKLDSIFSMQAVVTKEDVEPILDSIRNGASLRTTTFSVSSFAESVPLPASRPGAVINGLAYPFIGQTYRYTATFNLPLTGTPEIVWAVIGGTIVGQNTNPLNGPIYVDVQWNLPYFTPLFPFLSFIAVKDYSTGQMGILPIIVSTSLFVNKIFPLDQTVFYGQQPSVLFNPKTPLFGTLYYGYQWQVMDMYGDKQWQNIPNATSASYQPPALTSPWVLYRRLIVSKSSGAVSEASPAASVRMQKVDPGVISFSQTDLRLLASISYNTKPPVYSIWPARGGMSTPGSSYSYRWQYSENGAPWTDFGTSEAFPTATAPNVKKSNTKIRRLVTLTGVPASVLTLPAEFREGKSEELTVNTYYQSVDFENRNYIRENTVLVRGVEAWEDADLLTSDKKRQNTVYLDGLSRPIQAVAKGSHYDEDNGQWYDLVQTITYEAGGIVTRQNLPYATTDNFGKFKTNAETAQAQYYQTRFGETNAFSRIEFDGSPLSRPVKSFAPGTSWGGGNIASSGNYTAYNVGENVQRWTISYTEGAVPVSAGAYKTGWLLKSMSVDENNKQVINYVNKAGLLILKKVQLADPPSLSNQHNGWLCTYYVYDDFDRLRFIITPKAVSQMEGAGWTISQNIANELCFRYEYDERDRQVIRKSPGKGEEYVVYDQKDRAVYTQDGNMRLSGEWLTTLYDGFNRPVVTGKVTYANGRTDLQNSVNTLTTTPANPAPGIVADLILNITTSGTKQALRSITMVEGFETASSGEFGAEIVAGAGGPDGETFYIEEVAVNRSPLASGMTFTAYTVKYYDQYTYTGVKTFTELNTLPFAYTGGELSFTAYQRKTERTFGMVTGEKIRVLDGGANLPSWLMTTNYYDEEGNRIETLSDNAKKGTDLMASQYFFDGRVLSTVQKHTAQGTLYTDFPTITKYKYDRVGRLAGIAKKINNVARAWVSSPFLSGIQEDNDNSYKLLATHKYNELRQRVRKTLAPQYNNGQAIEYLDYDYNLRGWLTGINKAYATGEYSADQWSHYFGIYVGYDNRDSKFNAVRLDGNITGVLWKSRGDNTPRKYDYRYDNANRLIEAGFVQKTNSGESWSSSKMNFTAKDITYDGNGNLITMTQMGVLMGNTAPLAIDQLNYYYQASGNKLSRIDDLAATGVANGKLGDFKDGPNGTGGTVIDYEYDQNGNMISDRNKGIGNGIQSGVTYNHLDKPALVMVEGKGTIQYLYDATGRKLQKIVTDNTAIPSGGIAKITTTTYAGTFVYEGDNLQYIAHEEGRVRIITPYNNAGDPGNVIGGGIDMPGGKQGVFDYFITDHLENIRAVVTEEINKGTSICTMEDSDPNIRQYEESIFGQAGSANEVSVTRTSKPGGWTSADLPGVPNNKVSKLSSQTTTPQIGPNVLLKVMAGDKISAGSYYYYAQNPGSAAGASNALSAMLQGLGGALLGGAAGIPAKDAATAITNNLGATVPLQTLFSNQPGAGSPTPRAFLNYLFFDEQFNYVAQGSGFARVQTPGNGAAPLIMMESRAPKNGYVYVYLSNESSEPVYFDRFAVSHERGQLIQEDHYYAYGLRIGSISSKAQGTLNNKSQFQGSFSEMIEELEVNWNEFPLRNYDPQIGRWTTMDPFNEFANPYTGMGNNPANFNDPTGGYIGCPGAASAFFTTSTSFFAVTLPATFASTAMSSIAGQTTSFINYIGNTQVAGRQAALPMSTSNPGIGYQLNDQLNNSLSYTTDVVDNQQPGTIDNIEALDEEEPQIDPYSFCQRITQDLYTYVEKNYENYKKAVSGVPTPFDDCITLHIKILKMLMPEKDISPNIPKINYSKFVKYLINKGLSDPAKVFNMKDKNGKEAINVSQGVGLMNSVADYLAAATPIGERYLFGGSYMGDYHVFTIVVTRTKGYKGEITPDGKYKVTEYVDEEFQYMDQLKGLTKRFTTRAELDNYLVFWLNINGASHPTWPGNVKINQLKTQ